MKKEKTIFDRTQQVAEVDSKIIVALERIAEAFRVLLWNETKQYGLSPIQVQMLIFIMTHPPQQCKVSYLAQEFNMTKATISDSIKALEQKDLLKRETEATDNRSYIFRLTNDGKKITEKISLFANPLRQPLQEFTREEKRQSLIRVTTFNIQPSPGENNCGTANVFYLPPLPGWQEKNEHYCRLLQMTLQKADLRIDCPNMNIPVKFRSGAFA